MIRSCLAVLFSLFATFAAQAQDQSRAILVLDASGSMWGQIDGVAKITIAQEVIGDLLATLPEDQLLGLTVYGHRRKGDCSDIETLHLPGVDRAEIAATVNAISPRGKTPLSAAVIQAAEALKYTEEVATVILISDGIETCSLDPCEVGRRLEETGVAFTTHVIGFDVSDAQTQAQLQCLAEETGGTYRSADNAAELSEALQVIAEPEPPMPVTITFAATEGQGGPVLSEGLVWTMQTDADGMLYNHQMSGGLRHDLLPGMGFVEVLRITDEASAEATFTVGDNAMTVTLVLPKFTPAASLEAPATAVAGSNINIGWQGPNGERDYITVSEIGMTGHQYIAYEYSREGSPVSLKMPLHPGEYQLRYVLNKDREIIASQSIMITPVEASLVAPDVVAAGSTVLVEWQGPNYERDYIAMATPTAKVNQYETYEYTRDGSPAHIRVPTIPGTYQLRYIAAGPDQMVLTIRDITVEEVSASVEFPASVAAGSELQVTWSGPNNDRDYLSIAEVGSRVQDELTYAYTGNSVGDRLTLKVPTTPGNYEVRYIQNGDPKAMLVAEPLVVEAVSATLKFTPNVAAGSEMLVTWEGPNDARDYLAIAEIGSRVQDELTYAYTDHSVGNALTVKVPTTPGTYELRYIQNGDPKAMLASEPLVVEAVTATLTFAANVAAGSEMQVTWAGPNDARDYLAIAETGSRVQDELSYAYTETSVGDSLTLKVPTTPGSYELRYIQNGDPKTMLVSKPLVVEAVTASLEHAPSVPAGGKLLVTWQGPKDPRDYLAIAEIGARVSDEETYVYVENSAGSAINIDVPTRPGTYELRYIQNGNPKAMLAASQVVVEPVSATLEAAASVAPGGNLVVTWTGPDYQNDYIAISRIGQDGYESYTYTNNGSPLIVKAPDAPGAYELRYVINRDRQVITRQALSVE